MDQPLRHASVMFGTLRVATLAAVFAAQLTRAAETPPAAVPPVVLPAVSALTTPTPQNNAVENAVVKIFSTMRGPDPYKPWTKQAPREATGTGIIIEGKRILTNAHVVLYASQVQVQANQSGDKISATVESIAPGIDLAVLKLEDDTFFDTRPPLPRATMLPSVKDAVMVYGFPTGGTSLSITKGIVSRIEFALYNFPTSGLRIQIDAAINPGNSGGPALVGDKMIGLAFSRLGGGDNIGYIIPCEEVDLFLADVADGRYDGKPTMFDELQTLENPALRAFLKLDKTVEGIVVHEPDSNDPAYPLKEWDVITKIGDTRVDNEGMIKLGDNLRVRLRYLIQKIAKDGKVPLTIVRDRQELTVQVPVAPNRPMLIPNLEGSYPSYFVYGPLVFSPATGIFVGGLSNNNAMTALAASASPLALRRTDKPAFAGEELVVVASPFFPHKLSKGYSNPQARVVDTVNGTKIKSLKHLIEVLRDSRDEFIILEFAGHGGESPIFPRKEMLAATEDILTDNGVRSQASPDMLAVWTAKPAQ
ncbi:MAG: trypsin-like peptidase domain-containing protein [Verrucomicrobia bacterium]|nr:trypsin-like peptidase domain-containing protein [Verrucomicrobiota bacterium]